MQLQRLQIYGKDAEELINLQEMLYAIYTAVSKNDMARKFIKVGIHIMISTFTQIFTHLKGHVWLTWAAIIFYIKKKPEKTQKLNFNLC